ncbi:MULTISPECIES: HNH endonuclease signature motif containing protein [Xanthomonas]|uniref:57R n=2 Tax=Xanthomonas TaxID=338 RepID=A0A7Z7IYG8_XANCH|nr:MULTISPECIES: HNH endonuclease signature motif containing protein [Xanthomonas]ATS39292.1 HNH endonuclease [Xanthomonas citri pv. phaseoli var. fuscans]ATS41901.1 HNH endonuclease [Xanthomonas citri pv. phaseoli var. fuscans]ATS47295.1 HNH endonuclease [Xanthomonas citri pv. phaseoli var. fuscans]ATS86326.1 HNH endonuclease [Xanthomonas citri pv. phaseoli var. fuscans]QWN20936.1 Fis family transcriptional regulator [Xanthomonas citri]
MITYEEAIKLLSYEPETGQLRWKMSRPKAKAGSVAGSIKGNGYVQVRVVGKMYLAHRLAWLLTHGAWPKAQIDHMNGIRHDNRLANLRECTNAQNQQNLGLLRHNTSGCIGASWRAQKGKWRANIRAHGKVRHLGYFSTPEQAHAAYIAAKAQLHEFQPVPRDKI